MLGSELEATPVVLSPEKQMVQADPQPILRVTDLHKSFPVKLGLFKRGAVSAVNGVSFDVYPGETLGIVGESGCGKSTTARLILRLIDRTSGDVLFDGTDVSQINRGIMYRGIQMVFQDPYSSLNPRMSIGENIAFPMKVNGYAGTRCRSASPSCSGRSACTRTMPRTSRIR